MEDDFQEIDLLDVPNQELSTVLNDQDLYIQIRSLGSELFFSIKKDTNFIVSNIRFPINGIYYIPSLLGSFFFTGSYDYTTLGYTSFLYFIKNNI